MIGVIDFYVVVFGIIWGDYGVFVGCNIIYGFDVIEIVKWEIFFWFKDEEVNEWDVIFNFWLYEQIIFIIFCLIVMVMEV